VTDELASDIRATAVDIAADSAEIQAIEEEKTELLPGEPRQLELSKRSERLARILVTKTIAERELVEEAALRTGTDGPG
jgi:hypothetical protein